MLSYFALCLHLLSAGYFDYTLTSSLLIIPSQHVTLHMTILGTVLLDNMLMQLGFPAAEYRHRQYEDHKTGVTVIFNTSKIPFQGSLVPTSISGIRSMDIAVAEHSAAVAAIRYMESASNLVVKDLNYVRMKQVEKENKYLRSELKKAKFKSTRLGRGWFLSLRHMRSFAAQFHNMAILGYFGRQQIITDDAEVALENINKTTQLLKERSATLMTKLDQVRKSS